MNTNMPNRCGLDMIVAQWKTTLRCMSSWTLCCLLMYFSSFINLLIGSMAHCWTLAGYTWQVALKFTRVQLELITNPNIYLMVESAIRGGTSTVSNRLATANNTYLGMKSYDPLKPTSFIVSWDVINLYGYCMLSKLPCGNFQFLEDLKNFDFQTVKHDNDTGYILEVDLHYPAELHDSHSDLQLAPEHLEITPAMLSDYSKTDTNFHGQVALTPNLYDKTKYVLYLRSL